MEESCELNGLRSELFVIKHLINRSPYQFRILLEEVGVNLNSYNCDLITSASGGIQQHLRYVEDEDVKNAGCGGEHNTEIQCVKQECRSAVAQAVFENGSMVRVLYF